MVKIGDRIKMIREEKGLTQITLAEKVNYDQSYISKLEKGVQEPSGGLLNMIAKALGISAEELVKETDASQLITTEPENDWDAALMALNKVYPKSEFAITTCLWCGDKTPAFSGCLYTTLCSHECSAELRYIYRHFGWPIDEGYMLTPLLGILQLDDYGLFLNPPTQDAVVHGLVPEAELVKTYHKHRHSRGPFRERLLSERPELKAVIRGGVPTRGRKEVLQCTPKINRNESEKAEQGEDDDSDG